MTDQGSLLWNGELLLAEQATFGCRWQIKTKNIIPEEPPFVLYLMSYNKHTFSLPRCSGKDIRVAAIPQLETLT